ncbi:MAG: EexN family lipoprotein [Enterobacterales bacterium]|nr:EexN family lipoprotein [Enterobacterales bacterium]
MKKCFLILAISFLTTACAPSVDDLINDPALLSKITKQCAQKALSGEDINTTECKNAAKAQRKKMGNMIGGLLD